VYEEKKTKRTQGAGARADIVAAEGVEGLDDGTDGFEVSDKR
jgi:hypothetical protein